MFLFLLSHYFHLSYACALSLALSLSHTHTATQTKGDGSKTAGLQADNILLAYLSVHPRMYISVCVRTNLCVHSFEMIISSHTHTHTSLLLIPESSTFLFLLKWSSSAIHLVINCMPIDIQFSLHPHPPTQHTHTHTSFRVHINTVFELPGVLRRLAAEGSTTTPPTPKHASEQRAHKHRHPPTHE